jgi:hypothetical protein
MTRPANRAFKRPGEGLTLACVHGVEVSAAALLFPAPGEI